MAQMLNRTRIAVLASLTLGWRQVRHSWRLLLLTGSGILVAVLLALFVPLYAYQSLESGLIATLARSNANPSFASQGTNLVVSHQIDIPQWLEQQGFYEQEDQQVQQVVAQQVGAYVQSSVERAMQLSNLDLHTHDLGGAERYLSITSTPLADVAPVLKLTAGRLPNDMLVSAAIPAQPLEAAIPTSVANELNLTVGSRITIPLIIAGSLGFPKQGTLFPFTIQIVGIFQTPIASTLPFFEQNPFQIERFPSISGPSIVQYPVLVGQKALLATLQNPDVIGALSSVLTTLTFFWFYQPALAHFTIENLNDIDSSFNQLPEVINEAVQHNPLQPFIVASSLIGDNSPLQIFHAQVLVANIPIIVLSLDILGILLFFITLIAELFIDGQAESIAQLRSRGISRLQIFGGYLLQSVGAGIGALVIAAALFYPLTAILLPRLLTKYAPPLTFAQSFEYGWLEALLVTAFAVVALWICVGIALQSDLLRVRREASRNERPPLWQRWHLDVMLGVVLLISFGISAYALQTASSAQSTALLEPLSLIAPVFLVVAGILFLLRALPWFFRQAARLVERRRGAVAFLACLQLARTPQTVLRLLLVFSLTIAFMVSAFVFEASQSTRVQDLAAQEVGADIVGYVDAPKNASTVAQITSLYLKIPHVRSATVGIKDEGSPLVASNTSLVDILALDSDTYQQTAVWPGQTSEQSLRAMLASLVAERASAVAADEVPALVNSSMWNDFHLSPGAVFHLSVSGYGSDKSMKFVALAEVPTIPSVDATQAAMLTDYQTYNQVRRQDTMQPFIIPFIVWLRLQPHADSHAVLNAALASPQTALKNYQERQVILGQLLSDPLALIIVRMLLIGLVLPLVLAFIGNLIAIWTQMRRQNITLALARALGMGPAQIRNLLIWEIGLMQGLALVLGSLFGGMLAYALTPALIYSTATPSQTDSVQGFFQLQSVLPVRIIWPPAVLVALLVFVALASIIVVVGVAGLQRRAISQALRLNED